MGFEVWELGTRHERIGTHRTERDARRACRTDLGRTVWIIDSLGRIVDGYRNGRPCRG